MDRSGSLATGPGQMLLTFHSCCISGRSVHESRVEHSHRPSAVEALRML